MTNFLLLMLIYFGIYAILSLSLNLIVGYTGLLSLGHAGFFAIGAYTTAILTTSGSMNFWLALLLSGFVTSIFGILIGIPTLRLKGDYLAIATLGFGEIVRNILLNWDSLTNGPMGINGIPAPTLFGITFSSMEKISFAILVWIIVGIVYFSLRRIIHSRLGRALEAIREDEIAASSMGINIVKYKIGAFSVGAFFAGIAGSLWAAYNQTVTPDTFNFMMSVMILCMVVLGGLGNNFAAIAGAALITISAELPRLLGFSHIIPAQANQMLFGFILVLMMIFRPQGIMGRKKINYEKIMKDNLQEENL